MLSASHRRPTLQAVSTIEGAALSCLPLCQKLSGAPFTYSSEHRWFLILAKGVKLHSDRLAVVTATREHLPGFHLSHRYFISTFNLLQRQILVPSCAGEETEAQTLNDWHHHMTPKKLPDDETGG